jgi:MFS family permease
VGTTTSSVHMGMSHFIDRLSDRFGRRRLIVAAPLLFAVSCLLVTAANTVGVVLALAAINGLCLSLFWPTFEAWVAERETGNGLAHDMGSFNMAWTAAQVVGPILSGFLFSLYSRLPFMFAAGLCLSLFLLVWSSVQDRRPKAVCEDQTPTEETSISQRSFLYAAWVANLTSWFLLGNVRYQFPKLASSLSISPQLIGILMGSVAFAQFSGFFFLRATGRWHYQKSFLLGAQMIAVAGLFSITVFSKPLLFAFALLLIGASVSVTYYSSMYYAVHLMAKKGKGTGLHESILGIGAVLGPILGGLAAQWAGIRAPYILCLVVLFTAVATEVRLLRKRPNGTDTLK